MPSQPSVLLPLQPNVSFQTIVTTGEALPLDGVFGGVPDGIGAFDNGDGTITVLVNHEIGTTQGIVRDHGATGAYVDRLVIDKASLAITQADDLIKTVMLWNATTSSYVAASGTALRFQRFCSGDLPEQSALFDSQTGLGTRQHLYFTGEETSPNGRPLVTIVDGTGAGTAYELARLGNQAFENIVANPYEQGKTIVATTDDETGGELYFYIGTKTATGNAIDRAGLTNGLLYGLAVSGFADEGENAPATGRFSLKAVGDSSIGVTQAGNVSNIDGAAIESWSETHDITGWLRPEDFSWDAEDPRVGYFVTTDAFNAHSRLYQIVFDDITNPLAGGQVNLLVDSRDIGAQMFDNITVANGKVVIQEDPGNQPYVARVWEYDIASDGIQAIATFDPAKFTPPAAGTTNPAFITADEESSGVIDVTGLLGDNNTRVYLLDAQVHAATGNPATVEQGQLLAMRVTDPAPEGTNGDDVLHGNSTAQVIEDRNGDDVIFAWGGNDRLFGGNGDDQLHGGTGDDLLNGGNGNDWLWGDLGNDTLIGGRGDDYFIFDNKGIGNGTDRIVDFGGGDRVLTTVQLAANAKGIVSFGGSALKLFDEGTVTINDGAIQKLAYKGTLVLDGVTYYSYGLAPGDKGVTGAFYHSEIEAVGVAGTKFLALDLY